jgi:hypothetical protein
MTGVQNAYTAVPSYEPPKREPETSFNQLLRLDSIKRPGLSEVEFKNLFAKCRCGIVATRRVFNDHICAVVPAVQVIDLTLSDDDN